MNNLKLLIDLKHRIVINSVSTFFSRNSRLRVTVVSIFALIFWLFIFAVFYRGFAFFHKNIPKEYFALVIEYLFSIFYCALFMMLFFSSLIIAFSAFFHNKEARYLMTCPVLPENIFLYKFIETFLFATWAVFFLGIPWGVSYGVQQGVPAVFYPALIFSFIPYIIIPCALGTLACFVIVLYIARFRKLLAAVSLLAMLALLVMLAYSIASVRKETPVYTAAWLFGILDYLNFTQYAFLPSLWMSKAMLSIAHRANAEFIFNFLLLLSTSLFLVTICYWVANFGYNLAWSRVHSHQGKKALWRLSALRGTLRSFFFLTPRARLFLEKDIKVFVRDPMQWTQFAILLGLLLIYILNLRTLRYDQKALMWKGIVSTLNLAATSLTVCTFASRFIFPMLSLEGKRFWTLGVMPIQRRSIMLAKFTFAVATLVFISQTLVVLSCYMLRLPWSLTFFQCIVVLAAVFGVAGLSVGLGAIYPNFNEDSPSKIVSGFGGTLNLVLSLAFIFALILLQAFPSHYILKGKGNVIWLVVTIALGTLLSFGACILPMLVGIRKFNRIEI